MEKQDLTPFLVAGASGLVGRALVGRMLADEGGPGVVSCRTQAGEGKNWSVPSNLPADELLEVRNFGETTLSEVKEKLSELGLRLGMRVPPFQATRL